MEGIAARRNKYMNILYIDTRDNKKIIVRLETEKGKLEEQSGAIAERAQATLPLIEKILNKASLAINEINEINVETGPGSFTGIRIGISIANALSFAGLVKLNGKKLGEIKEPSY